VAVTTDPLIGSELVGYRIEALLGRGGMGVVYRAVDLALERNVALKLLAPELVEDERFRARFHRESRLAASIDHPHILPVYEAGEVDGQLYIAMRYVEGTDLKTLLREDGPLDVGRALGLCGQIADALDAAHDRGLIHRDIKPSNVLVARQGGREEAYLGDFGLVTSASDRSALTDAGRILGTIDYIAPEAVEGGHVDARSDLYSLGCLLYECLTGKVPFPRDSELSVLWAHVHEPPPRPSERRPELGADLDGVIAQALAKQPERRSRRRRRELPGGCELSSPQRPSSRRASPPCSRWP
jgi:serine/threonine-protein kinase